MPNGIHVGDLLVAPCGRTALAMHPPLDGRTDDPEKSAVAGRHCTRGVGVNGMSDDGIGVFASSTSGEGMHGETSSPVFAAIAGYSLNPSGSSVGVWGSSKAGEGVHGETSSPVFAAIAGYSLNPSGSSAGVWGSSKAGEGVHGETNSTGSAAVVGIQLNPASTGAAIFGEHKGDGPAGFFQGNVVVTKDIFLTNADCAEDFDIARAEAIEPGTVMVIDREGALAQSHQPYDKRVAGIVSGAGPCRPAIVLDKQESHPGRMPIALVGKVYCKADAQYSPIDVGDLLTTSPTPGHAMKATDPGKAFGSVIGKALGMLEAGTDLIPVLVALQ